MSRTVCACIPVWNDDYSLLVSVRALAPVVEHVLIYDDRSTDKTPQVIARLAQEFPNLRVVDRPPATRQIGWSSARQVLQQQGAKLAQRLLFVDSDDILMETRLPELRKMAAADAPVIQVGLVEMWGDFRSGTGRGVERAHHDQCHTMLDRQSGARWTIHDTFTKLKAPMRALCWPVATFAHAKGVKSDLRLVGRQLIREWMRLHPPESFDLWLAKRLEGVDIHGRAMEGLTRNRTDPLIQLPESVPIPAVCGRHARFEVIWTAGKPVDRLDHGWEMEDKGG